MDSIKIGDIVSRKSYNSDIFFRVANIEQRGNEKIFILKGLSYRLLADSDEGDLILVEVDNKIVCECNVKGRDTHKQSRYKNNFVKPY